MIRGSVLALVAAVGVSGCGVFYDRTAAYREAGSIAPLPIPEGVSTRPIQPLYPIPDVAEGVRPPDVDKAGVPFPPALPLLTTDTLPALPDVAGRLPVALGTDGNGIPELRVVGPRERVWDELNRAVVASGIRVVDRNQSLGVIEIEVSQEPFQLRLVRATESFMVSLQRNDTALAPIPLARNVLAALESRWPQ